MTGNSKFTIILFSILGFTAVLIGGGFLYYNQYIQPQLSEGETFIQAISEGGSLNTSSQNEETPDDGYVSFDSAADFRAYIDTVSDASTYSVVTEATGVGIDTSFAEVSEALGSADSALVEKSTPSRVSETNVQVVGVDEPDIMKTNGTELFVTEEYPNYYSYSNRSYGDDESTTKIISAFPVEDLALQETIDAAGQLLLVDDVLVVLSDTTIRAFDVSDSENPLELWEMEFDEDTYYETARTYDGQLYLITRTRIQYNEPCPISPLSIESQDVIVGCADIYHPEYPADIESTYTVLSIDLETGATDDAVAYVGSSSSSVFYMSQENIYLTQGYQDSQADMVFDFITEEVNDIVSDDIIRAMKQVNEYDISDEAKMIEYGRYLQQFQSTLSDDEQLELETEVQNRFDDYAEEHKREITTTGIVRIDREQLQIQATGSVPGTLLNQFSLDEFEGHLRVATTVSAGIYTSFAAGVTEPVNDLTILDSNLDEVSAIQGLAEEERIYAVRFMEDIAYMVTFKQVDPFFVFDLSDPKNPTQEGELKIPGYSSYLHPVDDDLVIGIGKDGANVKASLFDVSDASDPEEVSTYTLEEYSSEALYDHHAFLHDPEHEIFFIPGNRGGYILSYANQELTLEKAVATRDAQRALFIDEYLYVVGVDEIVVFSEETWEKEAELTIGTQKNVINPIVPEPTIDPIPLEASTESNE